MGMRADTADMDQLLRHAAWLRRMARALIHDPDMANDVVQATLISAWQHPPTALVHERPWLGKVAMNKARDLLRGESRRKLREEAAYEGVPASVPGPDELLGEIAIHRTVAEVVSALAEPYRETILLRYYEGLDATRIADRLGISPGTVRWRLKEGLTQLRRALDQRHHGDRNPWVLALMPTTGVVPIRSSNSAGPPPTLPRNISTRRVGWKAMGLKLGLVACMVLSLGMLMKTLLPSTPIGRSSSAMAPAQPPLERTPAAIGTAKNLPRLRLVAPSSQDPQPAPAQALPSPEEMVRHMLRAIETGAYEAFLDYADDLMKASLHRDTLDKVAVSLGEKLEAGFTLTTLGNVRREDHVDHLWKLELNSGGDDRLVRLSLALGYAHGFWIE